MRLKPNVVRTATWVVVVLFCTAVPQRGSYGAGQIQPTTTKCAVDPGAPRGPDPNLYCIELLPAAGLDDATGTARLVPAPSPFGVAVSPAGEHLYDIVFDVGGLPDPASLGPYTAYVAWARFSPET